MKPIKAMTIAEMEYIFDELNGFRWPASLDIKPEGWIDYAPGQDDGLPAIESWRIWKETDAGKTQSRIMDELKPLLGRM